MIAKKLALLTAATASSLLLLECGARIHYRFTEGEPFDAAATRARLAPAADTDWIVRRPDDGPEQNAHYVGGKVLHPFLGFVVDHSRYPQSINRFGLWGIDPLQPADTDEVRVAVTGGSVALQLWNDGDRALKRALAGVPAFEGKRIEFVDLAVGGYKQPQQLMALAWLLSLGAHFDVVINLDGFNEVTLPFTDNRPSRIHSAFPRGWQLFSQKGLDAKQLEYLLQMNDIGQQRNRWRFALGSGLPSESAFLLRALDAVDGRLAAEAAQLDADFREALNERGNDAQISGPFVPQPDADVFFDELVSVWKRSSLQMHYLCAGSGIAYYHFLQPNQYVEGSKPLSPLERRRRYRSGDYPPKMAVQKAYARLSRAGVELREAGVAFTDLTQLFEDETRTVYEDACCHFNARGLSEIARHIGRIVRVGLEPLDP